MRYCFTFLLVLLSACLPDLEASAQTTPNLKDPDALFAAALANNGLASDDLKPWHLKASYDILDHTNEVIATGVFEEWWAAKDKWKRSYTGPHYSGTEYHLPEGSAYEGTPWPESLIPTKLIAPISADAPNTALSLKPRHMQIRMLDVAKPPLVCVAHAGPAFDPHWPTRPNNSLGYCLDANRTELRISGFSGLNTVYNRVGIFQGRSIGLELKVGVNQHALLNVHVLSLTGMTAEEEGVFTPSVPIFPTKPDARLHVEAGVLAGRKLSGKEPSYPLAAERNREQGLVIIEAVINQQGKIENAQVLETPSDLLGNAALMAVRTWTYQPYLIDGQPTKVSTTINVVYNLGR